MINWCTVLFNFFIVTAVETHPQLDVYQYAVIEFRVLGNFEDQRAV